MKALSLLFLTLRIWTGRPSKLNCRRRAGRAPIYDATGALEEKFRVAGGGPDLRYSKDRQGVFIPPFILGIRGQTYPWEAALRASNTG